MRQEARALLADARRLEDQAVETHPQRRADPVRHDRRDSTARSWAAGASTCSSSTRRVRRTEPGCWMPLLRCDRVVLAGDHCQLPPTVLSQEAARQGLRRQPARAAGRPVWGSVTRRLDVQYRMHEAIMAFSSAEFYDGALRADASVAAASTVRSAGRAGRAADRGAGAVHRHGRGELRRGVGAGRREPAEPAGGGAGRRGRCGRCWTPACGRRTWR